MSRDRGSVTRKVGRDSTKYHGRIWKRKEGLGDMRQAMPRPGVVEGCLEATSTIHSHMQPIHFSRTNGENPRADFSAE